MKPILRTGFLFWLIFGGWMHAQLERADRYFDVMYYDKALPLYQEAVVKNPTGSTMAKIADCHWAMGNKNDAATWYARAVQSGKTDTATLLRCGLALQTAGRYDDAKRHYLRFADVLGNENVMKFVRNCEAAIEFRKDSSRYKILKVDVNSDASDIGPVYYLNGIVFASTRHHAGFLRSRNRGGQFYDLYYAQKSAAGNFSRPRFMQGKINTYLHDGPVSFTSPGNFAYITRSGLIHGMTRRDDARMNRLRIFRAERIANRWTRIEDLPFNADGYSVAHPCIAPDEKTLYFASDMPGGQGGFDIWTSTWDGAQWSKPLNLGEKVNSRGNDAYPTLGSDGKLYFASDGHPGMGGLDIFMSEPVAGAWSVPVNLGFPLNSSSDDFGIVWDASKPEGFFASDRAGGSGGDDIWKVIRNPVFRGRILSMPDSSGVPNAAVDIMDMNGKKNTYYTDAEGYYTFYPDAGKDVQMSVRANGFRPAKKVIAGRDLMDSYSRKGWVGMEKDLLFLFTGNVMDKLTGEPIPQATITFISKQREEMKLPPDGTFAYSLDLNKEYTALIGAEGYAPMVLDFHTREVTSVVLYPVEAQLEKKPFMYVEGKITAKESGAPLPGAMLHYVDEKEHVSVSSFRTREDGTYHAVVDPVPDGGVIASHLDYFATRTEVADTDSLARPHVRVDMELVKVDTGKIVKTVFFAYNKSDLNVMGMKDLEEIIYFMKYNPGVKVELSAHADSRGTAAYNLALSERRAGATVNFIVDRSIPHDRIYAKGYGETMLINRCSDGVPCTEEEHALNRRCEVKAVKIEYGKEGILSYDFGDENSGTR